MPWKMLWSWSGGQIVIRMHGERVENDEKE